MGNIWPEVCRNGENFQVMQVRAILCFTLLCSFFSSYSQKLFEDKINVSTGAVADNREAIIYLPANYSKTKAYPLVIFTHGMGEAGKDVKKLYKQGLPLVLKKGYRPPFDFIMVAVQRGSFSVTPAWLPGILKDCERRWKIDQTRIYLTGLSAGGWAVYGSQLNISLDFAKRFAAIVINSGVTDNADKKHFDWWKQTRTPIWATVGAADKGYVGKNAYMVSEINKRVPGLASLTIRPGVGHGGWSDIYNGKLKLNGKNMWEWLYQYKRTVGDTKPGGEGGGAPNGGDGNDPADNPKGDDNGDDEPGDARNKYIMVNVYKGLNPYLHAGWNNWDVGAVQGNDIAAGKFLYSDGKASTVTATLSSSFRVVDNLSTYGGGMVAAEVLRYTSYDTSSRVLVIKGLSPSRKYNITLYGSRRRRPGNTTLYRINDTNRTVETSDNLKEKAAFADITPDKNGRITVSIKNLNKYNYLNGFSITEKGPANK